MKNPCSRLSLVCIEWQDATMIGKEQMGADDPAIRLMRGYSCGVLVRETEEYVALALDYFADDHPNTEPYRVVNVYPKSGITKIHRWTVPLRE